ncbi:hypothetical protein BN871_DH_00120 [Paenibacillus sp. P22]|nr:hypothetical protein BN871_DH_00120 [Paenibacillus sp. P22]
MLLHEILDEADDLQRRIERVHRGLRNIGDFPAENLLAQPLLAELHDVDAAYGDRAFSVIERREIKAHQAHRQRRLAAAGLAGDAERLALLEREVDAVDGEHLFVQTRPIVRLEPFDLQYAPQGLGGKFGLQGPPASGSCALTPDFRIEDLVHAGVDHVQREGDDGDREGGRDERPPRPGDRSFEDERPVHDDAERDRVVRPQAEHGNGSLRQDAGSDLEDEGHDDVGSDIRQNFEDDDLRRAVSGYFGQIDMIPVPQRARLGAHRPRGPRPARKADDQGDEQRAAGVDADGDQDQDDERRDDDEHVRHRGQDVVEKAPGVSAQQPDRQTDDRGEDARDEADHDGGADAVDELQEQVAAEVVGAEQQPPRPEAGTPAPPSTADRPG